MKKKSPMRKQAAAVKTSKRPASLRPAAAPAARPAAAPAAEDGEAAEQDLDKILTELNGNGDKKIWNHWTQVQCPYCGENFDVHFDTVEDGHTVNEDCAVCCKPIVVSVDLEDEDIHVSAYRA